MNKLILPILIFFILSAPTQAELNLEPTWDERVDGDAILKTYRKLRNFRYSKIKYFKAKELNVKSKKFKTQVDVLNNFIKIIKVAKKGKDVKFVKKCNVANAKSTHQSVTKEISSELKDVCIEIFLNQITHKDIYQTEIRDFLVQNITSFTKRKNLKHFKKWLTKIKKNEDTKKIIKKILTVNITKLNLSKELLADFSFSKEMTIETQKKVLNRARHESLFRKEINRNERDFYHSLKKGDTDKAKKILLALADFSLANKEYFTNSFLADNFIAMVRRLSVEGVHHEGKSVLKKIRSIAGKEEYDDLTFYTLYTHLVREDYKGAYKEIKNQGLLKNIEHHSGRIQFWAAYTMKQIGMLKSAEKLYELTLKKSPLNYYSILARKELRHPLDTSYYEKDKKEYLNNFKKIKGSLRDSIERLTVWLRLGHERFVEHELNDIIDYHIYNIKNFEKSSLFGLENRTKLVVFSLASLLNKNSKHLLNFKLILKSINRNIIPFNEDNLKYLFPLDYLEKIARINNKVDPILVLSLIRQESAFNPNALSHAGARGLMQLMPSTARMYAKFKSSKTLRKPALNLKIGIKYLSSLLKKYDGDLLQTLAAYNAGERRVSRWSQEIFISDNPLLNVESIPFRETRYYIKLIFRNKFFYDYLTNNKTNLASIESSFKVGYNNTDQTLKRK
ncbi:MAG: lytic transglycosylase domain-containing protein [Bacteriovoracaceae bacterium]